MRRTLTFYEASASGEVFVWFQAVGGDLPLPQEKVPFGGLELSTQSLNPRSWSPGLLLSEPDL